MKSRPLRYTRPFIHDYHALPETIQEQADEALRRLATDARHPSLRVRKMQPASRGIFEARVTRGYRMTFEVDGEVFLLRHTVELRWFEVSAGRDDPAELARRMAAVCEAG